MIRQFIFSNNHQVARAPSWIWPVPLLNPSRCRRLETSGCVPCGIRVPKTTVRFDDCLEGLTEDILYFWFRFIAAKECTLKPGKENGTQDRVQAWASCFFLPVQPCRRDLMLPAAVCEECCQPSWGSSLGHSVCSVFTGGYAGVKHPHD